MLHNFSCAIILFIIYRLLCSLPETNRDTGVSRRFSSSGASHPVTLSARLQLETHEGTSTESASPDMRQGQPARVRRATSAASSPHLRLLRSESQPVPIVEEGPQPTALVDQQALSTPPVRGQLRHLRRAVSDTAPAVALPRGSATSNTAGTTSPPVRHLQRSESNGIGVLPVASAATASPARRSSLAEASENVSAGR